MDTSRPVQVSDTPQALCDLGTGSGAIDLQARQVTEGAWLDTGSGNITADPTGSPETRRRTRAWGGVTHGRAGVPVYGGHRFCAVLLPRRPSRHGGRHGSGGSPSRPTSCGTFTAEVGSGDVTSPPGRWTRRRERWQRGFTHGGPGPGALSVDLTSGPIHLTPPEEAPSPPP